MWFPWSLLKPAYTPTSAITADSMIAKKALPRKIDEICLPDVLEIMQKELNPDHERVSMNRS
jgi:hypothetical protein